MAFEVSTTKTISEYRFPYTRVLVSFQSSNDGYSVSFELDEKETELSRTEQWSFGKGYEANDLAVGFYRYLNRSLCDTLGGQEELDTLYDELSKINCTYELGKQKHEQRQHLRDIRKIQKLIFK